MIAKTYWAVLLIEHHSVTCCSVHEDMDSAKRDYEKLRNDFMELRYDIAEISI